MATTTSLRLSPARSAADPGSTWATTVPSVTPVRSAAAIPQTTRATVKARMTGASDGPEAGEAMVIMVRLPCSSLILEFRRSAGAAQAARAAS